MVPGIMREHGSGTEKVVDGSVLRHRPPLRAAGTQSQWVSTVEQAPELSHTGMSSGGYLSTSSSLSHPGLLLGVDLPLSFQSDLHVGQVQGNTRECPQEERPERLEGKGAKRDWQRACSS